MGYAGALEPQHIIPSAIAVKGGAGRGGGMKTGHKGVDDLDFFIGDDAFTNANYDTKVSCSYVVTFEMFLHT